MVAILGYSREQIFRAVKGMYTTVANTPQAGFHFPVGDSACRVLGYPPEQIEELPEVLRESFAGVGYPFRARSIRHGDTVLDIGAGAGNDSMIASRLVGPDGHVIALDLTPAMTRKLHTSVIQAGVNNTNVVQASAERLPLSDASVDSITSNGALNLVPDKRRTIAEMFRVLRPHGRLQIADVVINRPVSVDCHEDPQLWVECVVGATVEEDFFAMFRDAGFEDIQVLRTHDYFSHSPSPQTRAIAASFGARSIEVGMRRSSRSPNRAWQLLQRLNPRRLFTAMWRRGFTGMFSLGLALLTCYGMLAAVGALTLLGINLALNETLWAGAIALFALITAVSIAAGKRHHQAFGPTLLAVAAVGVILYALFVRYHVYVELNGFLMLAGAVCWDILLRRREDSRALGLKQQRVPFMD